MPPGPSPTNGVCRRGSGPSGAGFTLAAMQTGLGSEIERILAGAELWVRPEGEAPASAGASGVAMLAGWEDGYTGCVPFAATDGADSCRACPVALVTAVLATGHARVDDCPNGQRMLAFPAPAGSRTSAAVLRLEAPGSTTTPTGGADLLAAARHLRRPGGLLAWQVEQRQRGADRRRTAAAVVAQTIAAAEEFHRLYTSANRDRASSEQTATRLDTLARETLRESDQARVQVAHVLHDTAAQSMVSAHRFMEAARASLGGSRPENAPRHLDAAQERLLTAIREVRVVLNTLVPPGLEELGLANALKIYTRDNVPESIATAVTGELPRTEGWLEADLFALTVEAVTNAVQHAQASRITIDLREARGRGIITVTDDGVGFDPAAARRRTGEGMGLIGMTRRASWLGGRVDVTSRIGSGTTIRIAAPLVEPEGADDADMPVPGGPQEP